MLRAQRFEEAAGLAERALREAAARSPAAFTETARGIVAWRGIFANANEEAASEPYFRAVARVLAELAGPESPTSIAAAENHAGILGALGKIDEAIALRERVFESVSRRFTLDDPRLMQVRDGLAFLYRRAGREADASRLFENVGMCEHLAPALCYALSHGATVTACCRPWSENCHIWIYFDKLLDCAGLIRGLALDACITIHDHRGTHDGSERGLVCGIHHDALMGPHPADAGASTSTITIA